MENTTSEGASRPEEDRLRGAIEATALGFEVGSRDVSRLCQEARRLGVVGVCVPPALVEEARRRLGDAGLRVVTVVNFPLGHEPAPTLEAAAREARRAGADVVDAVFPLHCVPDGSWDAATHLLDALERGLDGGRHRLILETAAWSEETLVELVEFVRERRVPAVKTSTGFHPAGGASPAAVGALRRGLPAGVEIKASGGIRSRSGALALLEAGASILGTSSAGALLHQP